MLNVLNEKEIQALRENQDLITPEILESIRKKYGKKTALKILETKQDSEKYFLDSFGNRISYNGDKSLKKADVQMNYSAIHRYEIERCSKDFFYFAENYLQIVTPSGVDFLDLRDYQIEFLSILIQDNIEKVINMSPRQSGKSVIVGAYLCWVFNFRKELNIGIVANKGAMAREFLDKIKKMYVNIPIWLQSGIVVWNKGSIEGNRNIRILTDVPGDSAFRGYTINLMVIDECAWIKSKTFFELQDSAIAAQSSLSFKKLILISTPNGKNHFYDIWSKAGPDLETSENGYVRYETQWDRVPRYDSENELINPNDFKKSIIKSYGERYFAQNFGNDFLGSSLTLVSGNIIESLDIQEPQLNQKKYGIKIFKDYDRTKQYIMAVDGAKSGDDFLAFQILEISEKGFEQVCVCRTQMDYLRMIPIIADYAESYNAMLVVENNDGSGQSIADFINEQYDCNLFFEEKKKYPGFRTTTKTRSIILTILKSLLENKKLIIHDLDTQSELRSFVEINGKYQAEPGKHDDLVMSLSLCFAIFTSAKNFEDFDSLIESVYENKDFSSEMINSKYLYSDIDLDGDVISQLREIKNRDSDYLGFF